MITRRRSKLRRRDIASHRYFQQTCSYVRPQSSRGVTKAPTLPPQASEGSRLITCFNNRVGESKTILRFDGDSIAYFWALEVETAISHETLRDHWQELANALVSSPWD